MNFNEMKNTKSRFETSCNANLNDIIMKDGQQIALENLIVEEKSDETSLFLTWNIDPESLLMTLMQC